MTPGQMFMLRMKKNQQCRETALSTLHECGNGWWLVVVGGLSRGRVLKLPSRSAAAAAVTTYYNQQLFQAMHAPRTVTVSERRPV